MEVSVFVNTASTTSVPLEVVERLDDQATIDITVYSYFEPENDGFSCPVLSLGADSSFDLAAYRRLYRLLRDDTPDIFHVHPNATGSIARIIASMARVPHIVSTEHSIHTAYGPLKNFVNGSSNWLSDVVICNSETTAKSLSRWESSLLSLSGTETTVIHNGVDMEKIAAAADHEPTLPDGFLIGTVGRLVPAKNQSTIIEAIGQLHDDFPDMNVVLVGDGPLRDDLETVAEENGISDRVHFTGQIPREEVYSILHSLDLFVFPSLWEGFGLAVAEAMAAGTPVVANDIAVLQEVVGNGGILIDADDKSKFGETIESLYRDKGRRRTLAAAGRERIERCFTLERTVSQHIGLYRSLSENENGGRTVYDG